MIPTPQGDEHRLTRLTILALFALLVARLAATLLSGVELYADEAQYWRWSRSFELGYYSKPPMIAWVIGAFTSVFGNAEWAIRLPAPLLHTAAALALFGLGRDMFGARVGMLAALGYALMPGVIVSSAVISTDGVLLPFWSAGLWLAWRLREQRAGWLGGVGLGLCIGAGLLSKYAMLYFLIGLALSALIDAPTRRAMLAPKGLVALAVGAAIFAPHMAWNAANEFKTVSHTVDNANLGGELLNPENILKFLEDQMAVFGPVSFLALLGGLYAFVIAPREGGREARDLWLLAFILPVILIIAGQSVLSRAHANWAATAYPAASVLVAAWLVRARPNALMWAVIAGLTGAAILFAPDLAFWLKALLALVFSGAILAAGLLSQWRPSGLLWTSIGLHGLVAAAMVAVMASPPSVTAALGLDNAFKRVRGWEDSARQIAEAARDMQASAILVDEREVWHGLDYYLRGTEHPPLIAWRRNDGPKSFSEQRPLDDSLDDTVLVASFRPTNRPRMRGDFETFEHVGEIVIDLGQRANGCPIERRFVLYRASGYDEQARNREWEALYDGLSERPAPPCPARETD